MTDDSLQPPNPAGFDDYFRRSLASMAPDIEPALLGEIMPRIDEWIQQQADPPSRSDAIRRLIDLGLEAARKPASAITPTEADEVR